MGRNWNGSCEDWLHGDEPHGFDLPDADDYPPVEQWEIDEAKADKLKLIEQVVEHIRYDLAVNEEAPLCELLGFVDVDALKGYLSDEGEE